MIKIENRSIVCCDIDDTLIMYDYSHELSNKTIGIYNPETLEVLTVLPHFKHIQRLREFHIRGQYVILWSQSGVQWCETVVKALGIENYVDVIMTKPSWYIDDVKADFWMKHIYENMGT